MADRDWDPLGKIGYYIPGFEHLVFFLDYFILKLFEEWMERLNIFKT